MTAARLLAAASRLRELANAATPGPWESFRRGDPSGPFGVCSEHAGDIDADVFDGGTREDAAYIAAMSPPVALALADWLEFEARVPAPEPGRGVVTTSAYLGHPTPAALALAALIVPADAEVES